uniref:Putative secreted protein n=1 Tax=Anopheles marajoara TaxID=58244 RepID=A0A2M4C9U1_9DIPT
MWKFIIFRPVSFPFAFTMSERLTQPTMSNCLTTKAPRRSWRWLFGALLVHRYASGPDIKRISLLSFLGPPRSPPFGTQQRLLELEELLLE